MAQAKRFANLISKKKLIAGTSQFAVFFNITIFNLSTKMKAQEVYKRRAVIRRQQNVNKAL